DLTDRPGIFQFNTVVNNTGSTTNGAINCVIGQRIESSIVYNNANLVAGSQFKGCVLSNTVTGTDTAPGAIQLDPAFVSVAGDDYHLTASTQNDTCCIDKVSATVDGGGATLPTHDADLTPRPKGAARDIGAFELR